MAIEDDLKFENERRFVVQDTSIVSQAQSSEYIEQAYVFAHDGFAIRVRLVVSGDGATRRSRAWLTGKGPRIDSVREEYETTVSPLWASKIVSLSELKVQKRRYQLLGDNDATWEIDEFLGENEGLWIAELEGSAAIRKVRQPEWALKEIRNEPSLNNEELAVRPFSKWTYEERMRLQSGAW